jgi:DNA ligase (NAD+)
VESVRTKRPYDIDAIVVKADDISLQEELGRGSNGNPKGQIAWKFPNETAVTTLKDIEWSMGKGGQVTPVAIFESTFVAGGMLARASLGSYGEFKNLKLHKGDKIEISRRNDVIPHVERVVKASSNPVFVAPTKCPVCGKALEIGDKKIICKNKSCNAHELGDLMTWIRALDIKGMGDKIIEKLFKANVVGIPVDFYTANGFKVNKVMSLKVTKKIWEQLDAKKELPLDVFIDGLNIDNFGGSTTRALIKQGYDTLEKILALSKKQLSETEGIGDIKAEQVCEGLKAKRTLIEQLFYVGISIASPVKKKTGLPLSGKTILFTGTMSNGRKEMSAEAESFGAEVVERVSKDLSMLIVPDKAWVSDKTQKAKKLGIQILTEGEYRKLV